MSDEGPSKEETSEEETRVGPPEDGEAPAQGDREYDFSWLKKADEKASAEEPATEADRRPDGDGAQTSPPPVPPPGALERAVGDDGDEAERLREEQERAAWRQRKVERELAAKRAWNEQERAARQASDARPEPGEDAVSEPAPESAEETGEPDIDYLARAKETSLRHKEAQEEDKRDFVRIVQDVERHVRNGYDLIGLVGYSGSGKTHFLRALSLLLKTQRFEVAEWSALRKSRVPGFTAAEVFYYPASRDNREKWVFVDAGGELYARLSINDWQLAQDSAGLLHSLHHCRALFLLVHLQPGHFRLGSAGSHRWMSDEERAADAAVQDAQEELEFFDSFLLFLRALIATGGKVEELADRCADQGLDKALRPFRSTAPRLEIPVQVLFTQADKYSDSQIEVAEAIALSPHKTTVGVAPFVARHLPTLLATLLEHGRRFRFDFVQSYEERRVRASDGSRQLIPEWATDGGKLLSCGAMPALEFLIRNLPAKSFLRRQLQRREIDTRQALRLDRWLRRRLWRGVEMSL